MAHASLSGQAHKGPKTGFCRGVKDRLHAGIKLALE